MVGADHDAGAPLAADQLMRAVLANIVEGADLSIPPTDREQALVTQIKGHIVAGVFQLAGVARGKEMFVEMDGKEWIELSPDAAAEFNAASASVVEQVVAAAEANGLAARDYINALKK
jgi:hypothetical protein